MASLLKLKKVTKIFRGEVVPAELVALKDVDLEIFAGEFFVLLGPSGSGKSTLLRIMSGLEKDYRGNVEFFEDILPWDISFIFQQFAIFPWLTVEENISLGLKAKKLDSREEAVLVRKELEAMGMEKFSQAYPRELSGGMRQRVGIARALVRNPKIIFMDEPFSELDSFTAEELRKEVLRIWAERKMTIVMVTHIIEEALELADRIGVMTPQPGKIEKIIVNNLVRPRQKRSLVFYDLEDKISRLIRH